MALGLVSAEKSSAQDSEEVEDDFEFEESENEQDSQRKSRTWIQDPANDLCKALACRGNELCLLEDFYTAVCVNKGELKQSGDQIISREEADAKRNMGNGHTSTSDDLITGCRPCPVVKPVFLCGADNRTYSSLCRLQYHNCIHHTHVSIGCKGFCPCKDSFSYMARKQRQRDQVHQFVKKYERTVALNNKEIPVSYDHPLSRHNSRRYKTNHHQHVTKSTYSTKKHHMKSHNEVVYSKSNSLRQHKGCSPEVLRQMGERLVDWFSVIRSADANPSKVHKYHRKIHFPVYCKSEVEWMFRRTDSNLDGRLSLKELYDLEHDEQERCLKPFLDTCDLNRDVFLSAREWCKCFDKADRPCTARLKIASGLLGAYKPSCDDSGYYNSLQCHASIGSCWCVDKHGVEFGGTRTRGSPDCGKMRDSWETAEQDDGDDNDDVEGSADLPLDF